MHREQIKVLRALQVPEDISQSMVLGQYGGYREEPSVDRNSSTETYAALKLSVDNDRWRGMPFYAVSYTHLNDVGIKTVKNGQSRKIRRMRWGVHMQF